MPGKKVLICPLNWGLGHASRCIPVAREFFRQGYQVDFASDGPALELLKKEFPPASFFELPGYNITYPTRNILWNVGRKMISLMQAIRLENEETDRIVRQKGYDIVVSDNRFGCYAKEAYNIFMTHQVNILTPGGFLDPAVNKINHHFIRKYDECWIPDFAEGEGLTGKLGHHHNMAHARYIGPISRFIPQKAESRFFLTAILSGPEPQRSIWEKQLLDQLKEIPHPVALVSGRLSGLQEFPIPGNVSHYPFLTSQELNQLMTESETIICRGGYTTIMDLTALRKKAICVPTPGQTEQEYLTGIYAEKKYFPRQLQDEMNLAKAIDQLPEYTGIPFQIQSDLLTSVVKSIEFRGSAKIGKKNET